MTGTHDADKQKQAPAELIHNGEYSDRRWVEMMAGHHGMAVEMAKVALDRAKHAELKDFAQDMIDAQTEEIGTLEDLHAQVDGKGDLPTRPHPGERSMFGMLSVDELKTVGQFDREFIDSQLPHHASAVEMAAVAAQQSKHQGIRKMAHKIIDAQCKEIGKMIGWRHDWFGKMA